MIEITLSKGIRAGLGLNIGAWLSDIIFVLMSYFGIQLVSQLTSLPHYKITIGIIGGVLLIVMGISSVLNTQKVSLPDSKTAFKNQHNYWSIASKGFFINLLNPFNLIFWIGITTNSLEYEEIGDLGQEVFLFSLLTTIIFFDVVKLILAKKIRSKLSQENILKTRKIAGSILILLGVILMIRSL